MVAVCWGLTLTQPSALAEEFGLSTFVLSSGADPVAWCLERTGGIGVDGALITAATSSSDLVHLVAQSAASEAALFWLAWTGLELRRDLFYQKELSFQVSCSYGPGRYDPSYEQQG